MRSVISNFSRVVWLFMTLVATHNCVQAQAAGASEVHVETLESWTDADAFWQNLAARFTPEG